MARKKVQLAYIVSDASRKATFKKRKKGLLKKIHELTTLCGVEACAVLYSSYDPNPVVWPEKEQAQKLVEEFRQLPEMDQYRKMYDHPTYLKQRVHKATQQLNRLQRENREREVTLNMYGCISGKCTLDELNPADLSDLGWMVEHTLKEISLRLGHDTININDNGGKNINDYIQNYVAPTGQVVAQDGAIMMGPPAHPPSLLGDYFGSGYGNAIDMHVGPPMWAMEQYHQATLGGYDGANGSGGNNGVLDNMPMQFGNFYN